MCKKEALEHKPHAKQRTDKTTFMLDLSEKGPRTSPTYSVCETEAPDHYSHAQNVVRGNTTPIVCSVFKKDAPEHLSHTQRERKRPGNITHMLRM